VDLPCLRRGRWRWGIVGERSPAEVELEHAEGCQWLAAADAE